MEKTNQRGCWCSFQEAELLNDTLTSHRGSVCEQGLQARKLQRPYNKAW